MPKFLLVFFTFFLLFFILAPARAQSATPLTLFALETASFPAMTAGLDVFDSSGNFATGLTSADITLLEDNQPRPLEIEEFQPGVEFALVLDPGPYFGYRDSNAVSRFDRLLQVIKEWAAAHSDSLGDDLSLFPTGATPAVHLSTTAAFTEALAAYQPDLFSSVPNPETLSLALDAVSDPAPQAEAKPVVLYITTIPASADIPALQNLAQRAVAGNIRVHVWIVASGDSFSTSGATALNDLAIQTGGGVVLFSGVEPLPSPETVLEPLRHSYRLSYTSGILASGTHTLLVQANLDGETLASAPLTFELDVQPPNPILVAPPAQIVRTAPDERTTLTSAFLPSRQLVNIIVEFTDGLPRILVRTSLFVDGVLEDENLVEPFDQFSWDLSGYDLSARHVLTVEAVDTLGLSKVSLGVPVLVTVVQPATGLLPWLSRHSSEVALLAILFAGGVLGVILIRGLVKRRRSATGSRGSVRDPLTQSVQVGGAKRALNLAWARPGKPSDAYLVRLKDDGEPVDAPVIPVATAEMIFGSDPLRVTNILDDPSVSPVHAILKNMQGGYCLSDEKTVAGTWVNYEPVTSPRFLEHHDLLHIGQLSYRFMLRKPPDRPAPRVIPNKS